MIGWSVDWLVHGFIEWLTEDCFIDPCLIHLLGYDWLIEGLTDWLVDWLIDWSSERFFD